LSPFYNRYELKQYRYHQVFVYVNQASFCRLIILLSSEIGDSDVGGRIIMLVTFSNVLNRSPTFQTCHQQIFSPTSVTNTNVTVKNCIDGYQDVGDVMMMAVLRCWW